MANKWSGCVLLWVLGVCSLIDGLVHLVPSEMLHKRLAYMEDELISVSNLLLRSERLEHDGEDVHNITHIKSFLETTRALNEHVLDNMPKYTAHPIGTYIITKRLVKEWTEKVDMLRQHRLCQSDLATKLQNIHLTMPDEKDLEESMNNILRLQQIYRLKTSDLANGIIGENMTEPLSPKDSFEIGDYAVDKLDYYLALEWFNQVVSSCEGKNDLKDLKIAALLRIGSVYYRVRDYEQAMEYTQKALDADPDHKSAKRSMSFYSSTLKRGSGDQIKIKPYVAEIKMNRLYEETCSGRLTKKASVIFHPDYHCFMRERYYRGYMFDKVEFVHRNPDIVLYHRVVHQKTMRKLITALDKKLSKSVMQDAGYTKERHWAIITNESPRGRDLNGLFERITGVDQKLSASEYYAFNFAAGVTETPFADINTIQAHGQNSSMFIVFLNDVPAGGDTVFPLLKLAVKPERGSALFYYNNRPSGYVNKKLVFAECPVQLGTKWVTHKIYKQWVVEPPKFGNLLVDLWDF